MNDSTDVIHIDSVQFKDSVHTKGGMVSSADSSAFTMHYVVAREMLLLTRKSNQTQVLVPVSNIKCMAPVVTPTPHKVVVPTQAIKK